ncbi:hypothetical protein BJ138DRAFT_1019234, partial [Hygrophoropsis aurantiaca]
RVAQVRVIFSLSEKVRSFLFRGVSVPEYFAYVEWFSAFPNTPESTHGMYKISRSFRNGERLAGIVPVSNIRRSVHLIPKFGPVAPREWTSSTVLDMCNIFYVNNFTDRHAYLTIY